MNVPSTKRFVYRLSVMFMLFVLLVLLLPGSVVFAANDAGALAAPCATVEVVFARGSGQVVSTGDLDEEDEGETEAIRFRDQIVARVLSPLSYNFYELGAERVGSFQYPAVAVDGADFITGVGAKLSSGSGFEYGDSVREGVNELLWYMAGRVEKCGRGTRFILGGYSQGAQLIGQAYVDHFSDALRDRVVFNVLLGDPKLWLPEGEGSLFSSAPACTGNYVPSEWRRVVPVCETDNGSLGARKPYLPESFTTNTGLWCAEHDFICGSKKVFWDNAGHGTYKNPGDGIDQGVREAVERLLNDLPENSVEKEAAVEKNALDTIFYPNRSGSVGLDVVFVLDSTGSMYPYINSAKQIANELAGLVERNRGRVALVEYRDAGDEFTARILTPLTADVDEFMVALTGIQTDGGGDTPEALLHALMTAFDGLDWRPGATKAAVVLTDAGYHDPDKVDGTALEDVRKRSLEIDPVNVYPIVTPSWSLPDFYQPLADATSGRVIVNNWDKTVEAISETLTLIENRPVPVIEFDHYYGPVGSTIRVNATGSYAMSGEIVSWDWDWGGDGIYETLGAASIAEHRYDNEFAGHIQLRITDTTGNVANHSVPVTIGETNKTTQTPPDSLTATDHGDDQVTLNWEVTQDPGDSWWITLDGFPIGRIAPEARTVTITELRRGATVTFGIAPVSAAGEVGSSRSIEIFLPQKTETTPNPTKSDNPDLQTNQKTETTPPTNPKPNQTPTTTETKLTPDTGSTTLPVKPPTPQDPQQTPATTSGKTTEPKNSPHTEPKHTDPNLTPDVTPNVAPEAATLTPTIPLPQLPWIPIVTIFLILAAALGGLILLRRNN